MRQSPNIKIIALQSEDPQSKGPKSQEIKWIWEMMPRAKFQKNQGHLEQEVILKNKHVQKILHIWVDQ